jgi:hypothetical protein
MNFIKKYFSPTNYIIELAFVSTVVVIMDLAILDEDFLVNLLSYKKNVLFRNLPF